MGGGRKHRWTGADSECFACRGHSWVGSGNHGLHGPANQAGAGCVKGGCARRACLPRANTFDAKQGSGRPVGALPFPSCSARAPASLLLRCKDASRAAHPTVCALPGAALAANGNLSEPLTPFEGPDLAELLLMGSYLSRPRPRPPSSALLGGDRPETTASPGPGPAHPACPVPPACRVRSAAPTLEVARGLSYEDLVASPRRRRPRRRFAIIHPRQYPIQQARCLFLGAFSALPQTDHPKPVLPACTSTMFCTSVILKMASAKGKPTLRLALKQTVICMWSSLPGHLPNPCVRETLARALKENGQVRAKAEEDLTSLVEGRAGLARPEEGYPVPERQDDLRRRPEGSRSVQSAFRRLMVNGVLSSFVPTPGPLKRDFCSTSLEDSLMKKSHICFLSSCSKRNAITSSYSSTRGFLPLQRSRRGASGVPGPAPSSVQPQLPTKKASEESCHSSSSASVEPQRKIRNEKVADAPSGRKHTLKNRSLASAHSRPQKRKIPLLLSSRGNDPMILPPPPQLGYRVTAEDLDLERKAVIQWINKVLEG
ncbi:nuclear envelope pore membrane protein POM 121-like [Canis lupus familiaris]|uniref:nuclear envelope pore membrane protein POM 121-like n=1 Tax=Canis lupus familiaris TaxID=9615 RepID=UPI0018F721F3|nr:nuclear envelope pore membrane protein POM 121-like [Canis lupus familiaris]